MYKLLSFFTQQKQVLILAFIVIIAACSNEENTAPTESAEESNVVTLTPAQLQNAGISTDTLKQETFSSIIKLNGTIDVPPQNLASISMPLGGYLTHTKLLPGMAIRKGEIIATLEDQQFIQLQQDYLVEKSKLNLAKAEYDSQKELNATKAGSDKILEQATAAYQSANAMVNSLEEKLKLIHINPAKVSVDHISSKAYLYAPFTGFVTKVNVNIGKYVSPQDVLFELVNPEDIHLNLRVFEKDLPYLSEGQPLLAFTNTHPEKKYPCDIVLISKLIPEERAAEVHCHFDRYDHSLIPGMYMNAEVKTNSKSSMALPDDAVVRFEANDYVFVAQDSLHYTMTPVVIGESDNGLTIITNAASLQGKQLVTKGAYTLLMKLKNVSED